MLRLFDPRLRFVLLAEARANASAPGTLISFDPRNNVSIVRFVSNALAISAAPSSPNGYYPNTYRQRIHYFE